ncbi:spatacsin isoform X2 [Rhineura floridana]|uniref:spatacsin isoform X2 n=1 Tax=Rhineura floridana TaxID=261503 RepID=UPI002AC85227|nr:spatacsin isoform X2 [Rhineura floridana]
MPPARERPPEQPQRQHPAPSQDRLPPSTGPLTAPQWPSSPLPAKRGRGGAGAIRRRKTPILSGPAEGLRFPPPNALPQRPASLDGPFQRATARSTLGGVVPWEGLPPLLAPLRGRGSGPRWRRRLISEASDRPAGGGSFRGRMAGPLRVLLHPLRSAHPGTARAKLSGGQEALGTVVAAGSELRLTGLVSARPDKVASSTATLPGSWEDFTWEYVEEDEAFAVYSLRLLAVSKTYELVLYEVILKAGKCDVMPLQTCSEDRLKQLIEPKNISLSSVSSLRVLSFKNGRALLLLNNFLVAQLAFPGGGRELEVEELEECFLLDLSSEALERIVDVAFCRGVLFLLDESGWIYIFDATDGAYLAHVDVFLYQTEGQDEKHPDILSPLMLLNISHDLSIAVVANSSNSVAAIDLHLYFKEYPEHLICKRNFDNLPVEQLHGTDEDDVRSSDHSMNHMEHAFRIDRSWKAHLSSLYDTAKRSYSSNLAADIYLPWYQYILHLEHHERKTHEASEIFVLQDAAYVLSNSRGKSTSKRDRQWKSIRLGGLEDSGKLECKSVTGFSALFTLSSESEGLILVLWDFETQDMMRSYEGTTSFFVECSREEQLCLILSEPGLSLVLFGLTQEEFLNRLIIHGSAGTVDSLCQLNGWGRCSIPIHALEAGLENRQLDTVDFFLKTKENLFSLSSACSLCDQSPSIMSDFYVKSVEELRPALDLLYMAIRENDLEPQSKHFSEQLLNLTLSFLNKQLREIFIHREELDGNLDRCVDILTGYITKLRMFMIKFPHKPSSVASLQCDLEEDMPCIEESQKWEKFNTEQTIAEAVLNNKLPEAQTFFRMMGNPAQNLKELTRIGLDLVYKSLLKDDVKEASKLLRNMGFSVMEQLHKICFHVTDQHVRDFLVNVLQEKNYFSEAEKEVIDFVRQVENVYSRTFQENEETTDQTSYWRKEQDLSTHTAALDIFLNCSEDRVHNVEHRVMLNWAQWWDKVTREMVLLPTQSPEEFKSCNPEVLWMYLSSWHDRANISSWIAASQPQDSNTNWPQLTTDVIDRSTLCSCYMRNEILDDLASNGTFVPVELEDFESLLQRLALIGGVMQNPHPVPEYMSASGLHFHDCFILYCLEHGLDHLLYTYLDYYSLFSSNCPILDDKTLHEAHPWFEFLVQCRGIASNPGDVKMVFQASLANAQILIPSNQASVSTMLLEGRTLLALATTMYSPGGIDQVFQNGDGGETVDAQLFRMALAPYPKLRAALFPQYTCHGILPSDISLYHLVQSLVPFDPTKLFGWQSANTLAVTDVCTDLPHFSSSSLVHRYAVVERLDFSYYLRHERPSFAFGTFLVQQLTKSKTPKQLIQQAGDDAYALALSSFYVPSVAAACVSFLELLGLDSLKLRVDVKAANVILSFMSRREEPQHNSIRQSLVEKLTQLAEGETTAAEELLVCLEEAVWDKIEHQEIKKTSSEARKQWSLVVQFCRLHNIRLSISYLKVCARSNEWLQFIIEAQMYSYQPSEVLPVLQEFPSPLQDHLRLAFESLQTSGTPSEGQGDISRRLRHEQKPSSSRHPNDLFRTLLLCQEQPHPWHYLLGETVKHHAPILSILAACFQDASFIHCLCVWIITSLDSSTTAEVTNHIEGSVETHEWDLPDLATLWQLLLRRQKIRTLLRGFRLFLKDSPLLTILEVYELCMDYKSYSKAQSKLLVFQASLSKLQASHEAPPPILPVSWLESQASFLLELMLQQCRTQYELGKLLQLFADTETVLPHGPDMKKLSTLSFILKDSPVSVDRAILSRYTPENFQDECRRILEELQERSSFSTARDVAELAELPVDNVVIQEVLQNLHLLKQIGHWHQKRTRIEFWKKCHESYVRNALSTQAASSFFLAQADFVSESLDDERTSGVLERQLLLTLGGHWLSKSDPVPLDELERIEKEIWLCRIAQQTLNQGTGQAKHRFSHQISISGELSFDSLATEFSFSTLAALNMPKYLQLEGLPSHSALQATLPAAELEALNFLIGRLLDEGSVHEASRVCQYFNFYSRDVLLVLHCRALASGEAAHSCFHPEIQAVLAAREKEGKKGENGGEDSQKKRLQSTSSLESWSFEGGAGPDSEVVGSLQALIAECVHGRNYCRQVLCLFELSKELGCSFSEISAHDSEKLLRVILSSQRPDRCKKAQAFITTQGLEPEIVAALVAEEVTRELLAPSQGHKGGQKQTLNPAEESQVFLQLAKLCPDHTLVGMKLLDKISSVPRGELVCTTELLIVAHNCFSLTCHMEGIIRVLQAARLFTDEHLAPSEEYGLMVRLLIGIGRYNEMTYIFDLLHEKHYFEVLMRKKLDPNGTLKTALLDYIKRCRPGDSEKHNMIALCFSMCREIGENHEAAANIQLKLIESQPWAECLQDVPTLKKLLMKALTLYIDAAESYSKDFCVRQSLRCNRLTKLITLQLHFLNSRHSTKLISLSRKSLLECILSLPRFYQAAIVAEAYDFVPDWAEVLYQHVIVKGDFSYLEEYKQRGLLKTSTFEEIARKFKKHTGNEPALKNLKKLLTYCDDIYVYYKLAYDNHFYDVVNMLLKDAQTGCCLNDLLAN